MKAARDGIRKTALHPLYRIDWIHVHIPRGVDAKAVGSNERDSMLGT
jgi:hypothetical protein